MTRLRLVAGGLVLGFLAAWFLLPGGDTLQVWIDRIGLFVAASKAALTPYLPASWTSIPSLSVLLVSSIAVLPRAVYIAWRTIRFWRRMRKSKVGATLVRAAAAAA